MLYNCRFTVVLKKNHNFKSLNFFLSPFDVVTCPFLGQLAQVGHDNRKHSTGEDNSKSL